jgi:hypothetical protein
MDDEHTLHYASPIAPCTGIHPTPWGNEPCPEEDRLGFVFNNSDLDPTWHNLGAVEILTFESWTATWHRIGSVIPSNHTLLVAEPKANHYFGQYERQGGKRFIVENVREVSILNLVIWKVGRSVHVHCQLFSDLLT